MEREENVVEEEEEPQEERPKKPEPSKPAAGKYTVELAQIDGQWLLNLLSKYFEPPELQRTEKEILLILKAKSNMECEARLISLLEQDKIEVIKLLVKNRFRIYYGVKYAQSTQDKEKEALAEELKKVPEGEEILAQLTKKTSRKEDTKMRDEKEEEGLNLTHAASIKDEDISKVAKKILDFSQLEPKESKKESTKLRLPEGSVHTQKNGYEEVRIPARKHVVEDKLVRI